MKNGNKCSKCSSTDLLRIPHLPGDEPHIAVGERAMHMVGVSRYVCATCGYVEQWVDDVSELAALRSAYDTVH